jgi:hypothetical protein
VKPGVRLSAALIDDGVGGGEAPPWTVIGVAFMGQGGDDVAGAAQ